MRSPFLIYPEFISPLLCEQIISENKVDQSNFVSDAVPSKLEKFIPKWDSAFASSISTIVKDIESRYEATYVGTRPPLLQHYPELAEKPAEQPGCENSKYLRKKWVKVKDVDLVGILWLKDYQDSVPLDSAYEVYGGKMEFPVHNFSFVPQRGTLVIYPAGPHFITTISPILIGDLYQIKFNFSITEKDGSHWFYNPTKFPGKWETWLEEFL